jgi:hypothetical protein
MTDRREVRKKPYQSGKASAAPPPGGRSAVPEPITPVKRRVDQDFCLPPPPDEEQIAVSKAWIAQARGFLKSAGVAGERSVTHTTRPRPREPN